ncbi:MAG TPA: hypothetical protein DDZ89_20815 [Clostridiales bacterium]|nr:hypothetical protein [Clostridiales bacterium]
MRGGNYYNPEMIKTIQCNANSDPGVNWHMKKTVEQADKHLCNGNEFWWNFVAGNSIPRGAVPGETISGCPECGDEFLNKYGTYGWICLTENNTWKIQCPNCGMKFPSNDFKRFYDSGLNQDGFFESELADRSLLVNEIYPQYGPEKYVDDGTGYIDENGHSWAFAAYYHHWGIWLGLNGREKNQTGNIHTVLRHLADAWVYTGDVRYAITGLILLYRVSMIYPSMDLNVWMRRPGRPYRNSDGHRLQGKVVGSIWETFFSEGLCEAADAFLPVLDRYPKEIEEAFQPFATVNVQKIEESIIDGIVRQVYPGVKNGSILGNEGMHQAALAMAAVCMGRCEESEEWLDFLFRSGSSFSEKHPKMKISVHVTGGNIFGVLENKVDRDGMGDECSLGYNCLWLRQLYRLADILSFYPGIKGSAYDINRHPKMLMMYKSYMPWVIDERYVPNIGDNGSTGNPGLILTGSEDLKLLVDGYFLTKDPRILTYINMVWPDAKKGKFESSRITGKEKMMELLKQADLSEMKFYEKSDNACGFGNCILRQPEKDGNFVNFYYGRTVGHGHWDKLNFELFYKGINISPDLGYPEYCEAGFHNRLEWNNHTLSHNCVMVDDQCQKTTYHPGNVKGFEDDSIVKYIDVDAPDVYDNADMYNRSLSMIEVSPGKAYIVDFFRVSGGELHRFSLHGGEGPLTMKGVELEKKPGTVAGVDIAYGDNRDRHKGVGSGLSYLYDVEQCNSPGNNIEAIWQVKDTWGVTKGKIESISFKAWLLGSFSEIIKAKGKPPQNKPGNPKYLNYLLAVKRGRGLKSRFTSVYEAYEGQPEIVHLEEVSIKVMDPGSMKGHPGYVAGGVKVLLSGGTVDYICSSVCEDTEFLVDDKIRFKGRLGFLRTKEGKVLYALLSKGTLLEYGEKGYQFALSSPYESIRGCIKDFEKQFSEYHFVDVIFDQAPDLLTEIIGRTIHIQPAGPWNASYEIVDAYLQENNCYRLILNRTTVKGRDQEGNYTYLFKENASFEIPVLRTT